jgi:thioesterase domain-containing protein
MVSRAWREALGRRARLDLSWDRCGGDSLKALQLLLRIEESLGRRLPARLISGEMTAVSLSALLALEPEAPRLPSRPENLPWLFLAPGPAGPSIEFTAFARKLEEYSRVAILDYSVVDAVAEGPASFALLIDRLAAQVRHKGRGARVHLAGFSFGVRVAFELACRIEETESVFLVDASPAGAVFKQDRLSRRVARHLGRSGVGQVFERWVSLLAKWKWYAALRASVRVTERLEEGPQARLRASSAIYLEARRRHPFGYCSAPLVIFRTGDPRLNWALEPEDLGWGRHAANVKVFRLDEETHMTAIASPRLTARLIQEISGAAAPVR